MEALGFYLSALMVSTSVSLQYLSPTSLSIFLRAWSSKFKLDSFILKSEDMGLWEENALNSPDRNPSQSVVILEQL